MTYLFDSNIYISGIDETDAHHAICKPLIDAIFDLRFNLIGPVIVLIEVAANLARRTDNNELARQIYQSLLEHPGIRWVDLAIETARSASEFAIEARLKGADAMIAEIAFLYDVPLVTLDEDLRSRAVKGNRITTLNPAEIDLPSA